MDTDASDDADDADADTTEPVVVQHVSRTRATNTFYFRAGVAHVDARVTSGGLQLEPTPLVSIATGGMQLQGGVTSDPANLVAAIIGFSPAALGGHVGIETIVGLPSATKFRATGQLATQSLAPTALGVPTGIPPLGSDLGEATAVPLVLTANARLPIGPVTVYAGGGASVLFVTDAKITNAVLTQVATPKFDIAPALGVVAQAGVDVHLFDRFYARVDVKELWFQSSESTISNIRVATKIPFLDTVDVGSAKSEVTANPLIIQAGIGANF